MRGSGDAGLPGARPDPANELPRALRGRPPFAMAGPAGALKDVPRDLLACPVVTTTPSELVRPVHPDRMVAILPPEHWEAWLHSPREEALAPIRPIPAERMRVAAKGVGLKSDG